ncbi:MAG: nucleotidyltransferase family protein [Vulcanimicrobiota bacterium]
MSDHPLLLQAAFASEPELARQSWEQWLELFGHQVLDSDQTRLLPLLYRRLGAQVPGAGVLKHCYRHAWSRSRQLRRQTVELVTELNQVGVVPILLKGAALANFVYPDPALRPMSDIDLLIAPADWEVAWQRLEQLGWRYWGWASHTYTFSDSEGHELDVHRYSVPECVWPEADREFWRRSREVDLEGARARILGPEDQLLHLTLHAVRSPGRCLVADALTLLGNHWLDWDAFYAEARARRVLGQAVEGVQQLGHWHACPAAPRLSWREQLEHRLAVRARSWVPANYLWQYLLYCRGHRRRGSLRLFLRELWGVRPEQTLVARLVEKIIARGGRSSGAKRG